MGTKEMDRKKILVIFIAGIGDLVLFTPVLKGIKRHDENCEISIIVPPELVHCAKKMPYFTHILLCKTDNSYPILNRILELTRLCIYVMKRRFNIVIVPLVVNCFTASFLSKLTRAKKKISYSDTHNKAGMSTDENCIRTDPFEHDVVQNLKILQKLYIDPFDVRTEFHITEDDKRNADVFLKHNEVSGKDTMIALHPVTQRMRKNWPAERFAELGRKISNEYDARIIIIGSRNERGKAEEIKSVIGERAIVQAGKTSINVAAALLEKCALLVCNDSSIMHIGAALGVPMVAIWGPTKHYRRGYSGTGQIIVRKRLSCSPCRDGFYLQTCESNDCILEITVEDVFIHCKKILSASTENR